MNGGMLPPSRPRVAIDVSMAIVNIVLLLIFFFIVTGQMSVTSGVEGLELSETSELPLEQLPKPVLVVDRDGGWQLDGTPVAPELLGVALDALAQPVMLHLVIDRATPAEALVSVLRHPALRDRAVRLVTLHYRHRR